jgi:chromosome segregation ATPase
MLIALGFTLALILVLLFGHVTWNMAMRLGARRQAKQIPTAMLELQADRDRLRADHAMMSRKLELRLEDIKIRMTEQMAEVSRHRNRLQSMMQDIERRDEMIRIRDREVAALNAQLEVHKADLSACYDTIEKLTAESTHKDTQIGKQAAVIGQISISLREKSSLVGNLGQELQSALRVNTDAMAPKSEGSEDRIHQRIAELTSISSQMSSQRDENPFLADPTSQLGDHSNHQSPMASIARHESLHQQLADTEREAVAMAEQLKALDAIINPQKQIAEPQNQKKSGAMANVISLAQRIRALQRNAND